MLSQRDIQNILDTADDHDAAPDWEYWPDPPMDAAKCWSSRGGCWLVQYIPDPDAPSLAVGHSRRDGAHITTIVDDVGDHAAAKLLRLTALDPEAAMLLLHEKVDRSRTKMTAGVNRK